MIVELKATYILVIMNVKTVVIIVMDVEKVLLIIFVLSVLLPPMTKMFLVLLEVPILLKLL